jgi:D-alanyl-D-alanine carboxypeptidase (penicillin-binding protein 5/6)
MNPAKNEHNEVYKETARLFDWGFGAAGKVTPVGELVAPKGAGSGTQPGANPSASAAGNASAKPVAASVHEGGSSGIGVALGIAGGVVLLLGAGGFLVNRRWPLPDLVRRRTRP